MRLLEKYPDYEIINLDALTYCGNLENLEDIEDNPNYTFVKGDIQDAELVDSIVKDVDYIVHFAAESHVDRSIEDPQIFIKTNIIGTQVLLDAAKKHGIKKYLQVSTDEVYGSLGKEGYFTEETPLQANSPIFHRRNSTSGKQPIFRFKGRSRPNGQSLWRNFWFADQHHKMLKQLRPLSIP